MSKIQEKVTKNLITNNLPTNLNILIHEKKTIEKQQIQGSGQGPAESADKPGL